ncbi:reverse transcriptase domain-containing protein [Tanacetum coccineum]
MRFPDVPSMSIKLMIFPFSLEGSAWIWLEKEPPRSILTWNDLVSKFINQFFPPSKTTNLRNENLWIQQRFDESIRFYNALNANDQDSLDSVEGHGGICLDKMPRFPADFVVVDFEPDPRVPLILRRCFLKTDRSLIDVYEGELTLRVDNDAITYNLDQTLRYSVNYNDMTANLIDVVELACEEYSQEVLGFFDVIASGNPTLGYDPIVSNSSPTLTPFGDSDFLLLRKKLDCFSCICDDQLRGVDGIY